MSRAVGPPLPRWARASGTTTSPVRRWPTGTARAARSTDDHVTGGTSNPSIFAKAVLDSDLYDDELAAAPAVDSDAQVFERCWIEDIQRACDLVRPVWERTGGHDGYISIEEEADLAFEVEPAVARAHELRALVDRPNLMVKVPGTDAGVEAFRRLTREGLNINMTLLFSRERYRQIAEAYVAALSERVDAGEDVSAIASVASFFVSRIDVKADERLPEDSPLRGRIAVANAKLAYADVFLPSHSGAAWERLAAAGANPQRPLWASTGGKNPAYSPTLYIDGLIGEHTITTVPDATLDAFRDSPDPAPDRFTMLDDDRPRARRSRGAGRGGRRPRRDHHRPGTRRRRAVRGRLRADARRDRPQAPAHRRLVTAANTTKERQRPDARAGRGALSSPRSGSAAPPQRPGRPATHATKGTPWRSPRTRSST